MWIKTFLVLNILAPGVLCSNFLNSHNIFTSNLVFHRDHGYALIGHVIKTLDVIFIDCMTFCQETLSCFSFNYIDFHNGTFLCELNRSNKNQSRGSYIRREGYEYAESPVSVWTCCKQFNIYSFFFYWGNFLCQHLSLLYDAWLDNFLNSDWLTNTHPTENERSSLLVSIFPTTWKQVTIIRNAEEYSTTWFTEKKLMDVFNGIPIAI